MFAITRKGEYAIRGILYLARQPQGQTVMISEIAEAVQAPRTFLAKILQSFAKEGLVRSFRGAGGGFALGRPAAEITLREVVEAVEGPILPNRCLDRGTPCEVDGTCGVHQVWKRVQRQVTGILDSVTIAELAETG